MSDVFMELFSELIFIIFLNKLWDFLGICLIFCGALLLPTACKIFCSRIWNSMHLFAAIQFGSQTSKFHLSQPSLILPDVILLTQL